MYGREDRRRLFAIVGIGSALGAIFGARAYVASHPQAASEARYDRIPALGEDTDRILRELGYDAAAVARLREEKVI